MCPFGAVAYRKIPRKATGKTKPGVGPPAFSAEILDRRRQYVGFPADVPPDAPCAPRPPFLAALAAPKLGELPCGGFLSCCIIHVLSLLLVELVVIGVPQICLGNESLLSQMESATDILANSAGVPQNQIHWQAWRMSAIIPELHAIKFLDSMGLTVEHGIPYHRLAFV